MTAARPQASKKRAMPQASPWGLVPIEPAAAAERKVDQKDSRSEATLSFPLFASLRGDPPQEGWLFGVASFAYFSWRDKKSERLPGRSRRVLPTGERTELS
jgi:hypothetical protein